VGGSAVAPTGAEASGGIFINPGFGSRADVGAFGSLGAGGGVNVSGDAFVGFIFSGSEKIRGVTVNGNVSVGPFSVTTFFDPGSGDILGGTFGLGPGATPIGTSITESITGTLSFRDLLGDLLDFIQEQINEPSTCQ
jgi:hypothetical protein